MSAIDWLSETIIQDDPHSPGDSDVTNSASVQDISVQPLDQVMLDSIGILEPADIDLPGIFWGTGEAAAISSLLHSAELADTLPALSNFRHQILLSQVAPPVNSDGSVFLARVDALLAVGALEQADKLLQATDLDTPELFRRWFDISLLTGDESHACDVLRNSGDFAPTYQARVFCLARNGDWGAAALTLNSAETLQVISAADYDLIARFLDPDLYEDDPYPNPPLTPSPLMFRIYEAIGETIPTKTLPRAFAHADLRPIVGWKARLEAAERLTKAHALDPVTLRTIYLERSPAASGGHWDRVRLFQSFDRAILADDAEKISYLLPRFYQSMQDTGLEHVISALYSSKLSKLDLQSPADGIAYRMALISAEFDKDVPKLPVHPTSEEIFLSALADGQPGRVAPIENPKIQAVRDGYDGGQPDISYRLLLRDNRLGETLLRAAQDFDAGRDGDLALISRAIRVLRHTGQDTAARQFALEFLIMDHLT